MGIYDAKPIRFLKKSRKSVRAEIMKFTKSVTNWRRNESSVFKISVTVSITKIVPYWLASRTLPH